MAIWFTPDTAGVYWITCKVCNSEKQCDEDTIFIPVIESQIDTIIHELDEFPNGVGSYWIYLRTDSSLYDHSVSVDTVSIVIDDIFYLSEDSIGTYWSNFYNHNTSNAVTYISGDTVLFYEKSNDHLYEIFSLIFPLRINKGWRTTEWDSVTVDSIETIETPSGVFNYSYRIFHRWYYPNDLSHEIYWFVPYIGIVKYFELYYLTISVTSGRIYTWELIDYGINR
jgi:hypothetical protein